jgi:fumarylacetoacetase
MSTPAFGPNHLPYGSFSTLPDHSDRRLGIALGTHVVDLASLSAEGLVDDPAGALREPSLNAFMAQGPTRWSAVRSRLQELATNPIALEPHLVEMANTRMHLAWDVADYVDFYSSIHHATNVGKIFRPRSVATELETPSGRLSRTGRNRCRIRHADRSSARATEGSR